MLEIHRRDRFAHASRFVQVEHGRESIARLAADNANLIQADFLEVDADSLGKFDYIIAHGVYSWVSPEAQEAVLGIIERCLSPNGIAFVSYNTYPGWKAKEILRDAMLMHGGNRPRSAAEQVAYGRAMVGFLQKAVVKGTSTAAALEENAGQIMRAPDHYVAHDYLEPHNLPCYFHEFVARIGNHGLSYLGEAQPSMMIPSNYGQELSEQLYGALGEDQVRVEQYLDFAIGRSFRQSLLLRAERASALRWEVSRKTLHRMHFSANLSCADGAVKLDGQPQDFVAAANNRRISVALSGIKCAIALLAEQWPGTATRDELLEYAQREQGDRDAVPPEVLGNAIDELLEILVLRGMARMRLDALERERALVVDPLVRRQLAALSPGQDHVANIWHDSVDIGELERLLLPLMDGTRNREDLVAVVADALRQGQLPSTASGVAGDESRAGAVVDAALTRMRDSAVLLRGVQ